MLASNTGLSLPLLVVRTATWSRFDYTPSHY
jgi:hypothetical protein